MHDLRIRMLTTVPALWEERNHNKSTLPHAIDKWSAKTTLALMIFFLRITFKVNPPSFVGSTRAFTNQSDESEAKQTTF